LSIMPSAGFKHGLNPNHDHAVSIIARNPSQLLEGIKIAENAIRTRRKKNLTVETWWHTLPNQSGTLVSHSLCLSRLRKPFCRHGREIGTQWPEIYRQLDLDTEELKTQMIPHVYVPWRVSWGQDWESEADHDIESDTLHMIFGQVLHGGVMTNLIRTFGIEAESVIGYSLGESAGNFCPGCVAGSGSDASPDEKYGLIFQTSCGSL
jgi:hypothetical protein